MNAADLNAKTVKALNVIARDLKMTRYSKLRKAELIAAIVEFTYQAEREAEIAAIEVESTPNVTILSTEVAADVPAIVKIMAEAAPVAFSATPVKAPQMPAKTVKVATPTAVTESLRSYSTDELIAAYRGYRKTVLGMGNTPNRVKIALKAREIAAILKSRKVNMREV